MDSKQTDKWTAEKEGNWRRILKETALEMREKIRKEEEHGLVD